MSNGQQGAPTASSGSAAPTESSHPLARSDHPAARIGLVWAEAHGGVIGADGGIPWHIPEDLAHFKQITAASTVIMGRRTWESLPERFRPLPGRRNIVVTRQTEWADDGAEVTHTFRNALALAADTAVAATPAADAHDADADAQDADADADADARDARERLWVIGGAELWVEALTVADLIERTFIDLSVDGDTLAPKLGPEWQETAHDPADGWHVSRSGVNYRFSRLERA